MDNQKKSRNWYFFRQRKKRQKVVFQYQQRLVLKVIDDINFLRHQLNSTTHSLSIALSQKTILYDSLDKLKYLASISQAQHYNQLSIISNLKGQIKFLQSQKPKISLTAKIPKPDQNPNSKRKKKRRLSHFSVLFIPPKEKPFYEDDDVDELKLFL
eukprot:TRINITY_DN3022_c0_g1_i2.p1 TRINITY_DN3022_c0_g1~~TRINITY_DN3022_c0_g1_i2.p1  ORF type:complete len:156 (-),score=20.53 TRINITY_DN3022_c0_g1_i2:120-587(-)